MNRTWGGRFSGTLEEAMLRLSASVEVDSALAEDDIRGSMAHARALARAGVLTAPELETMVKGLEQVLGEVKNGTMVWKNELEDVHMNIEARLVELIGPLGGKLHTGRSRNDQVATDLRLWARRAAADVATGIDRLCAVLLDRADEHVTTLLPGYTHLQRARSGCGSPIPSGLVRECCGATAGASTMPRGVRRATPRLGRHCRHDVRHRSARGRQDLDFDRPWPSSTPPPAATS
jgi:hypothetical protein